jgi:hypothetical protein
MLTAVNEERAVAPMMMTEEEAMLSKGVPLMQAELPVGVVALPWVVSCMILGIAMGVGHLIWPGTGGLGVAL